MNHKISDMDPTEIRVAMLRANPKVTQSGMARDVGIRPQIVNRVIDGITTSDRVRKHIAKTLDIDIKRIWPSIYLYGGGPRKPGRPRGSKNVHKG